MLACGVLLEWGDREVGMTWMIFVILAFVWVLSVVSSYALGGFVYPLFVYLWFHSSIRPPRVDPH